MILRIYLFQTLILKQSICPFWVVFHQMQTRTLINDLILLGFCDFLLCEATPKKISMVNHQRNLKNLKFFKKLWRKLTERGDWTWYWFLECVWICWRYVGGSFGLEDSLEAWLDDSEALLSILWWISWARGVTLAFGVNPPLILRVISALEADLKTFLRLRRTKKKRRLSS